MDLPHPLQCVQGVVQKVGVQLSLHHTDLGVAKLLLLADGLRQVRFQPLSHPVEAARQLAQLINACDIHPHIQVAALYRFHGAVEPADRPEQLAAEAHGNHQAQSQTQYNRNRRHHVQKPHDPVRHGFRLAEQQIKARGLLPGHMIDLVSLGQALPRQQTVPQNRDKVSLTDRGRQIYLIPISVQHDHIAVGTAFSVK